MRINIVLFLFILVYNLTGVTLIAQDCPKERNLFYEFENQTIHYYRGQQIDTVIKLLLNTSKNCPQYKSECYFRIAYLYNQGINIDSSKNWLGRVLSVNSEHLGAKGLLYFNYLQDSIFNTKEISSLTNFSKIEVLLKDTVQKEYLPFLYYQFASIYSMTENHYKSLHFLDSCLLLYPDHYMARMMRIFKYEYFNRYNDASNDIRYLMETSDLISNASYMLAICLWKNADYKQANVYFNKALQENENAEVKKYCKLTSKCKPAPRKLQL